MPVHTIEYPSQETVRRLLDYSPETGEFRWRHRAESEFKLPWMAQRWNRRYAGTIAGSPYSNQYIGISISGSSYLAHRLAVIHQYGRLSREQEVDHINHNRTDNRIANLRLVSHKQNKKNATKQSNNKSGIPGVSWCKRERKWRAYIMDGQKHISLGNYGGFFDACCARKSAESRMGFHANHGRSPELQVCPQ